MGIFKSDGSRVTKSGVPTSAINALDLPKVLSEDLWRTRSYGKTDPKPEGSVRVLLARAGKVMTQRQINDLFPPASVSDVAPNTGGIAGGDVVTITGESLDGATGVNFGGVAGTEFAVTDDTEITVTTPAHAAGAVDVEIVDDGGNVTVVGGFTYA